MDVFGAVVSVSVLASICSLNSWSGNELASSLEDLCIANQGWRKLSWSVSKPLPINTQPQCSAVAPNGGIVMRSIRPVASNVLLTFKIDI